MDIIVFADACYLHVLIQVSIIPSYSSITPCHKDRHNERLDPNPANALTIASANVRRNLTRTQKPRQEDLGSANPIT
jgi:hypothetical protein